MKMQQKDAKDERCNKRMQKMKDATWGCNKWKMQQEVATEKDATRGCRRWKMQQEDATDEKCNKR